MSDLEQGDAKQRIRASGAIPIPPTYTGDPFNASFAAVGTQEDDTTSMQDAGTGRSVAYPVPMTIGDMDLYGGDAEFPYQIVPGIKANSHAIFLPEGCLVVDNDDVPVSKFGVSKANGFSGPWYTYPFSGNLEAGYLNVKVKRSSSGTVTVEEVKFTNGSPQEDEGSSSSSGEKTKIYSIAISKSTGGLTTTAQVVTSAIRITTDFSKTDNVSVEHDSDNEDKLQLYKFSGSDADGSPGLVQRITATADEDGNVTLSASDSSLMLICRKEKKIVYVPLSKESESQDPDGNDPTKESQDEVDEPESENADPATPGVGSLNQGDPGSSGSSSDDCGPGGVSPGGGGGTGGGNNGGYSGCDEC